MPPPPEGVVAEEVDIPLGPNDGRVRWSATPRATYYEIFEDGQYEATVSAPRTSSYDSSPNTFFGSLIFTEYTVHATSRVADQVCRYESVVTRRWRNVLVEKGLGF